MTHIISNWREYADAMIGVGDLDPVYDMLYNTRISIYNEEQLNVFLMHHLLFYDIGGAYRATCDTDDKHFWDYVINNYDDFPRGDERRHSRGKVGRGYIYHLGALRKTPTQILQYMYQPTMTKLSKHLTDNLAGCGFGPYFQWKVMDIFDRILGRPVSLSIDEALKYCPEQPLKVARHFWPTRTMEGLWEEMAEHIRKFPAPGIPNRGCSYSEVETTLCGMKGYFISKVHDIGADVQEKHDQLAASGALILAQYLPPIQDWSQYVRADSLDTETIAAS